MSITPAVLLDLDGTVADTRHRSYLINGPIKDWEAYSLGCVDDPPIPGTVALVRRLKANNNIIACSGRSVVAKDLTKDWMRNHGVPYNRLILRPEGDHTNNATFKLTSVKRMEAEGFTFHLAIEDNPKTAQALTDYGIPTLLVASYTDHGSNLVRL